MNRVLVAAIAAIVLLFGSSQSAQAYTVGTVTNYSGRVIKTANTYPSIAGQAYIYCCQTHKAAAFFCFATCISQWGYRYQTNYWHPMHTTGNLVLHD